jgi:hypothetical protein
MRQCDPGVLEGSGAGPYWVKSSLSFSNGNCVEVASLHDDAVGIRNSRYAQGLVLQFASSEWRAFLLGAKNGEFSQFGRA